MNRYVYWAIQIAVIALIVFTFTYSSISVVSDPLHVISGGYGEITYNIHMNNMANVRILGSFEVSNGTTKDVEVYIFDEYNFINWRNGYNSTPMFESGQVTASRLDLFLTRTDTYYVVFNNNYSESPKDIDVEISLIYNPALFALPLRIWALIVGIPISAIVTFYQYTKEQKRKTSTETSFMAFSLALIAIVGMTFYISPESTNWINTLLTALNVILVLWNLHLTQRGMKTQLLHMDRKKSLEKLYSILEDSKGYADLMKRIESFMATMDFELLPDSVKNKTRSRIRNLAVLESEAPWEPQYSEEELRRLMQEAEESSQQEWESMNESERFNAKLEAEERQVKQDIKKEIKRYFEEPTEE